MSYKGNYQNVKVKIYATEIEIVKKSKIPLNTTVIVI